MKLFDAHTHIDMKHFRNDRDAVIKRARDAGLVGMVNSSIGPGSFRRTLGLVNKYDGFVFHSPGCQVSKLTDEEALEIIDLTRKYSNNIVAVGEVGLDYYWVKDEAGRRAQEPRFIKFMELAMDLDLPIVVHSRNAELEASILLEKHFDGDVLMHCFDGSPSVAERVNDNGWFITLPANFDKHENRRKSTEILSLDQIMLETDGPYLSPVEGRNEPKNIVYGCNALAELKATDPELVAETTTDNALGFYDI